MKLVYIAGPYRAATPWQVEQNIRNAESVAYQVAGMGVAILCPHTMTRYWDRSYTDQYWLEATLEMMRRCDAVVLVPGWESSTGTLGEVAEAEALGIPVFRACGHGLREWIENGGGTRE